MKEIDITERYKKIREIIKEKEKCKTEQMIKMLTDYGNNTEECEKLSIATNINSLFMDITQLANLHMILWRLFEYSGDDNLDGIIDDTAFTYVRQ